MAEPKKKDELLDHDADGIREFDNSLPRWWLYGFYFTIVFGVIYLFLYDLEFGKSMGYLSSNEEYKRELSEASAFQASLPKAAQKKLVVLTDAASLAAGQAIFEGSNICHTCHKADMGGLVGPNLTDEYWIHGCSPDSIVAAIKSGFPEKGMLPYGNNSKLSDEQLIQVASYIISKKGSNPAEAKPIDPEREVACAEPATGIQ